MDNSSGVRFIIKNFILLLVAFIIGGALGGVATYLTPKKYLSTAIVYPYNANRVNDIVANPQFGYEMETEQLIQLLESRSMRDRTIQRFKLYDYYELDTSNNSWRGIVANSYKGDIKFEKSKFLSVVINVTTKDPVLSADIANFQIEEVNRYHQEVVAKNRQVKFDAIKEKYESNKLVLNQLKDSIYTLKKGNSQLLFNFVENLNNEDYDPSEFIDSPELERLIEKYLFELSKFNSLRGKFVQLEKAINEPLPSAYTVDTAQPNFKKASPSYLINIALGALVLFFVVLTIKLILDKLKSVKSSM